MIPRPDESHPSRVAWLTGGIGQGKTRLLRRLESAAEAAGRACVYVPVPTLDPACLTTWCLTELGLPGRGGAAALHAAARRGFSVLVDDADRLPPESKALLAALARRADADVRVLFASTEGPPEGFPADPRLKLAEEGILGRCCAALGLDSHASARSQDTVPAPSQLQARPARAEPARAAIGPGGGGDTAWPENAGGESGTAAATPPHEVRLAAEAGPHRWPVWLAAAAFGLALGVFVPRLLVPEQAPGPPAPVEPAVGMPVPEAVAVRASPRAEAAPGSPAASLQNDGPARPSRATPVAERVEEASGRPAEAGGSASVAARPSEPSEPTDGGDAVADAGAPAPPEAGTRPPERTPLIVGRREPPAAPGAAGRLPPVAAPPPVPSARRTRIIVNAIPAARVQVDGRFIGETPIAELDLEPGRYRFAAEFEAGTTIEREVEVSGDVMLLVFP